MKRPPLEYLLACSGMSLGDFELNRLDQACNLRKQLRAVEDDLRQAEAEAALARWLMEHRDNLLASGQSAIFQQSFEFIAGVEAQPIAALPPRRANRKRSVKEICA